MSRIGRLPIKIPDKVKVNAQPGLVQVEGPKGKVAQKLDREMRVSVADGQVKVERPNDSRRSRQLHGLSRTLVANMIQGVTQGYKKSLEIQGVGYKAEMKGKNLVLSVGYANQISMPVPPSVTVQLEGVNKIHVSGADKQAVGQFAAEVRKVRKPEPYKGKGIRYDGEQVKIKPGKAFAGAGAAK